MLRKPSLISFLIVATLLIISITACGPSKGYLAGASAYQDEEQLWDPGYRVYHLSDNTTRFYFIIPPGDILYVRNPNTYKFEASAEIGYRIVSNNNTPLETGTVEIKKEEDKIPNEALIGYFDIKIPSGSYYYAKVVLDDKLRNKQFTEILTINKTNYTSKENFIITDTTNRVNFLDYINPNEKIKISSERIKSSKLFVTKFELDESFPTPIYIDRDVKQNKLRIDTVFSIFSDQYISFQEKGIYLVSRDSASTAGLALFNFYEGYPLIAQKENLAPPMRYITSDEEFNSLDIGSESSKLKTEQLWASMSSSLPTTEKQLVTYYKRVQYSNIYYTSHKEGWKTDRGLVYTIFGQPSNIYKTPKEEKWSYGLTNSSLEFNFKFTKNRNPLSDNDFELKRNSNMKEIWQKAIETWRKGKVFDEAEIRRLQEELERQRNTRNNYFYPTYRGY